MTLVRLGPRRFKGRAVPFLGPLTRELTDQFRARLLRSKVFGDLLIFPQTGQYLGCCRGASAVRRCDLAGSPWDSGVAVKMTVLRFWYLKRQLHKGRPKPHVP